MKQIATSSGSMPLLVVCVCARALWCGMSRGCSVLLGPVAFVVNPVARGPRLVRLVARGRGGEREPDPLRHAAVAVLDVRVSRSGLWCRDP